MLTDLPTIDDRRKLREERRRGGNAISLRRLYDLAADRPPGMILECLTRGRLRSDNRLEFDPITALELRVKYRLDEPPDPTSLPCCE